MAEVRQIVCGTCGKLYDPYLDHCPHCAGEYAHDDGKTVNIQMDAQGNATVARGIAELSRTVGIYEQTEGIDPVVGWLVAVTGSKKGSDYRIRTGNNSIGRGRNMDILLEGDDTISRDNQAILAYDDKEKKYYLRPGEGRNLVRIGDKPLLQPTELNAYDRIEMGKTVLVFIPLCGEHFDWSKEKTEEEKTKETS